MTLIDRTNHHLFQPLLYQVATGILSEGQIAPAIRDIFRNYPSLRVVLGAVERIDLDARTVHADEFGEPVALHYDSLIVAGGATTSYFGHDEFRARRLRHEVPRRRAVPARRRSSAPSSSPRRRRTTRPAGGS